MSTVPVYQLVPYIDLLLNFLSHHPSYKKRLSFFIWLIKLFSSYIIHHKGNLKLSYIIIIHLRGTKKLSTQDFNMLNLTILFHKETNLTILLFPHFLVPYIQKKIIRLNNMTYLLFQ